MSNNKEISVYRRIPLLKYKHFFAWDVGGALVLLNTQSASLHSLDSLSSWLFLSLDKGMSKSEVEDELQENQGNTDILNTVFKGLEKIIKPSTGLAEPYIHEYDELIKSSGKAPSEIEYSVVISYLNKTFKIYTSCLVFSKYLQQFSCFSKTANDDAICCYVVLKQKGDGYQLIVNGIHVKDIVGYTYLMPALVDLIPSVAYQSSDYLISIHSAMLSYQGKGLMLPGVSGSGKSTLSMSLLSQGYHCYSDEVSVISAKTNKLMPLPMPGVIKSGSWSVLEQDFPDINSLPIWERTDGRLLKYIDLPHACHDLPEVPVTCIIFPHYQADIDAYELTMLDSVTALKQLSIASYQIRDNLTKEKVEQILNWITQIAVYDLRYSNLEDAHTVIRQLMEKHHDN